MGLFYNKNSILTSPFSACLCEHKVWLMPVTSWVKRRQRGGRPQVFGLKRLSPVKRLNLRRPRVCVISKALSLIPIVSRVPTPECIRVVARASSRVKSGRMEGTRRASMVLPEHGGPMIRMMWSKIPLARRFGVNN